MMNVYKLYNIRSDTSQNYIPRKPNVDEVWIKISGVTEKEFSNVENYNKDIWVRFNTSELQGIAIGDSTMGTQAEVPTGAATLFDFVPGIVTPSAAFAIRSDRIANAGFHLLAIPTISSNTDFEAISPNLVYTNAIAETNNLLVPDTSLVYYNYAPDQHGYRNPTFLVNSPQNNQMINQPNIQMMNLPNDKFLGYFIHYHVRQ
jgi:hypothetical protein